MYAVYIKRKNRYETGQRRGKKKKKKKARGGGG